MADEKKAYDAWLQREKQFLRQVEDMVYSYDSIDLIIELLAATLIYDVEEYLSNEYDESFREGIDGLTDAEPDSYEAVHADVAGKNFADRINEYLADVLAGGGLDALLLDMAGLIETDGHRVRCVARQDAGDELAAEGFAVTKTWRSIGDEKVRDTHFLLDGTTIGIDDYFYTVNGRAKAPGGFGVGEEDCNCRCILEISCT